MSKVLTERGETLIELMITVMVISIGVVALTAAMGSSVIASDAHRGMAVGEVIVRDYGEGIKDAASANVDTGITRNTNDYVACPDEELKPTAFTFEPGWQLAATEPFEVEWWVPDTDLSTDDWTSVRDECLDRFETQCGNSGAPSASDQYISACDPGLQRVTFNITNSRTDYAKTGVGATVVVRRGEAP